MFPVCIPIVLSTGGFSSPLGDKVGLSIWSPTVKKEYRVCVTDLILLIVAREEWNEM